MHFDFASRRTTGGLPALELKGTDQLKKGSSWPHSSGIETMSTMPDETRAVIIGLPSLLIRLVSV